jgi:cytoskeletal protein CcmA (bactofilin family)
VATTSGTTVIGESILINGSLTGDEDLTVRGRVEGTLTLTKTLVVEQSGIVKAEVQVRNCIIAGAVVGNVTATESVEITKEGRMVGDIAAPRVIIVDGASFRGRVDMGDLELPRGERPARTSAPRPAARPVAVVRSAPKAPERPAAKGGEDKKEGKEDGAKRGGPPAKPPAPPTAMSMGAIKRKVIVKRK